MVAPLVPVPSPFPNIEFPKPYWLNGLKQFVLIQCADPALLFVETLLPAALEAAWSIQTPSTKQLIHQATGQSWVCSAKQVIGQAEKGDKYASSGNTRFMYGLWRGLDTFAYFQFVADVIGQGAINWQSLINKGTQRCSGSLNPYSSTYAVYGAPGNLEVWGPGALYLNRAGGIVYTDLIVPPGHSYTMVTWLKLRGLNGTPVNFWQRIRDVTTGTIYDECECRGFDIEHDHAITFSQGAFPHNDRNREIVNEILLTKVADYRIVAESGGAFCHVR